MFAKLMETQGEDYNRFFRLAMTEFHLKIAGFLAELTHMGRAMLDSDGGNMPMLDVEERWIRTITDRNRRGALSHP